MTWMEPYAVVSVALLAGFLGGCFATLAHKSTSKFNMKLMEEYWNYDIKRLESDIEVERHRISDIFSDKNKAVKDNDKNKKGGKFGNGPVPRR